MMAPLRPVFGIEIVLAVALIGCEVGGGGSPRVPSTESPSFREVREGDRTAILSEFAARATAHGCTVSSHEDHAIANCPDGNVSIRTPNAGEGRHELTVNCQGDGVSSCRALFNAINATEPKPSSK